MTLIFNKVTFGYRDHPVLRDFSALLVPATVTAVVGSNGSGKSTLLSLLAGVAHPQRGRVDVGTREVAFAVQRSDVTDTFPITVAEAVMMGRWRRLGLLRRPTATDRAAVERWLSRLGVAGLRHRTLGELSGGQRQRVLLAQAFAQDAEVLLLDEPTTGLDTAATATVIAHLRALADAGTTVVAATHDQALVAAADRRIDLDSHVSALRLAT